MIYIGSGEIVFIIFEKANQSTFALAPIVIFFCYRGKSERKTCCSFKLFSCNSSSSFNIVFFYICSNILYLNMFCQEIFHLNIFCPNYFDLIIYFVRYIFLSILCPATKNQTMFVIIIRELSRKHCSIKTFVLATCYPAICVKQVIFIL